MWSMCTVHKNIIVNILVDHDAVLLKYRRPLLQVIPSMRTHNKNIIIILIFCFPLARQCEQGKLFDVQVLALGPERVDIDAI